MNATYIPVRHPSSAADRPLLQARAAHLGPYRSIGHPYPPPLPVLSARKRQSNNHKESENNDRVRFDTNYQEARPSDSRHQPTPVDGPIQTQSESYKQDASKRLHQKLGGSTTGLNRSRDTDLGIDDGLPPTHHTGSCPVAKHLSHPNTTRGAPASRIQPKTALRTFLLFTSSCCKHTRPLCCRFPVDTPNEPPHAPHKQY